MEPANEMIKDGRMAGLIQEFMAKYKPEVAYFMTLDGCRTAMFIVDMADNASMVPMGEPFFMDLNAKLDVIPVMTPEDLRRGLGMAGR